MQTLEIHSKERVYIYIFFFFCRCSFSLSGETMPVSPLHHQLQTALENFRQERNFIPEQWVNDKCAKLNSYMQRHGLHSCVTSVSGGIDSAVVIALCARAMKMDGSPIQKNIGLCQPISSSEWALSRGKENISSCGAEEIILDQTSMHQQLSKMVEDAVGIKGSEFASGQLRSYMRTPTAYYTAQLLSQNGYPSIVMGTGNKDEDFYLGYFCKAGDGVVDVQIISDLHKSEVFRVAELLGVPCSTRNAAPSADLWNGQTDEEELGFPYDFVEWFTGWYIAKGEEKKIDFVDSLSPTAKEQFKNFAKSCETVHRRNAHKLQGSINL